jgi:hypothetical protein
MMFGVSRRVIITAIVIVVVGLSVGAVGWRGTVNEAAEKPSVVVSGSPSNFKFTLSFGLSRLPITRSVLLSLCPENEERQRFPDCEAGAETPTTDAKARPEVTSAGVVADLQSDDGGEASDQFPADQLTVVGSNEGAEGLRIKVTAEPRQPERVPPGTYRGTLVVERSSGPPVHFAMTTVLNDPEGWVSQKAFLWLLLGAGAGALVKWLNDAFAPLAGLRRRQRRLTRTMRPDLPYLPLTVARALEDVRESIRLVDATGVADRLDLITKHKEELTEFAAAIRALQRELDVQRALVERMDDKSEKFNTFLRREQQRIDELLARPWPWSDAQKTLDDCREMLSAFESATDRLQGGDIGTDEDKNALAEELTGLAGSDRDLAREGAERAAAEAEAAERSKAREQESKQRRRKLEWLLDNSWWLMLAVSALAVSAIGYETEYLNNDGFEGAPSDYWKLAAWAFALQLAGTTVLEAAGRLALPRASAG